MTNAAGGGVAAGHPLPAILTSARKDTLPMSFKAMFGQIAVAIGHLQSASSGRLFDEQTAKINEAVVALRDAETAFEAHLADDVRAAIDTQLPLALEAALPGAVRSALDQMGLSAAVADHESRLNVMQGELDDLTAGVTDLDNVLSTPTAEGAVAALGESSSSGASASTDETSAPAAQAPDSSTEAAASSSTSDGEPPAPEADVTAGEPSPSPEPQPGSDASTGDAPSGSATTEPPATEASSAGGSDAAAGDAPAGEPAAVDTSSTADSSASANSTNGDAPAPASETLSGAQSESAPDAAATLS